MLVTIVRSLLVFVVLCLVSAPRPIAGSKHDDPTEARLDIAKSRAEFAVSRRDGDSRDPRDQRAGALALVAVPFALVPPPRTPLFEDRPVAPCAVVPVISARSSRGPPVG